MTNTEWRELPECCGYRKLALINTQTSEVIGKVEQNEDDFWSVDLGRGADREFTTLDAAKKFAESKAPILK